MKTVFHKVALSISLLLHGPGLAAKPLAPNFDPGQQVKYADGFAYTFIGNSNVLFTANGEGVLIDGWFSRFSQHTLMFRKIAPDPVSVDTALAKLNIRRNLGDGSPLGDGAIRLRAVIPGHSHYDHALDAGEVAKRTGAVLLGSKSTGKIGAAAGLSPCKDLDTGKGCRAEAEVDYVYGFGPFEVILRPSRHLVHRFIGAPLVNWKIIPRGEMPMEFSPPAKATDYLEGGVSGSRTNPGSYAIVVRHKASGAIAHVHTSTNAVEGAIKGECADIVFLSVAGLRHLKSSMIDGLLDETIVKPGARIVVPVHWDSLTDPLGKVAKDPTGIFRYVVGGSRWDQAKPLRRLDKRPHAPRIAMPELWRTYAIAADDPPAALREPCSTPLSGWRTLRLP